MVTARNVTRITHQQHIIITIGTIALPAPRSIDATECEKANKQ